MASSLNYSEILEYRRIFQYYYDSLGNKEDPTNNRAELFSSEQMRLHGKVLAKSHKIFDKNKIEILLSRLDENEEIILKVRKILVESIRSSKVITPAAEWLLDNFYLIEEQFLIARKHLPKGYSESLPHLSQGYSKGKPRVYDIALDIISHSDGRIDISSLTEFIESYQSYSLLSLGELWAIPIMLRLAVLENLRRLSIVIALEMLDHNLADYWADRLIETVKHEPENLILTISELAKSKPLFTKSFVAQFLKLVKGKGNVLILALNWMEQQLLRFSIESNLLVQQDNQNQAGDQVAVSNSISTLRLLGATDWNDFVENLSAVERILRTDPSDIYSKMDFKTRDNYRHGIEELSKAVSMPEDQLAEMILEMSKKSTESKTNKNHVGYYLIDEGLNRISEKSKKKVYKNIASKIGLKKFTLFVYIFSIVFLTLLFSLSMMKRIYDPEIINLSFLIFISLVSIIGFSQLSISFVNWISTILKSPKILPRMDFSQSIPDEFRTLVIVPTMISSMDNVGDLLESMEIRYLGNRNENIHFALVTDFIDSKEKLRENDELLMARTIQGIEELNEKYKHSNYDRFFLFHRPRIWNSVEKLWMGYERKRGKISDVNRLILNKDSKAFSHIQGDISILNSVKYIITLDADTQLPHDSAWKMIATMAHPLNRPVWNSEKKIVTNGYGILQPRVGAGIPNTRSRYLKIFSNIAGIDPYSQASSDVYQDLFSNGSFIGKGIYDVEFFEQAMKGKFKENKILSHDLIEGCFLRSGYLSDVLLYENDPISYFEDLKRKKRWIRGDWQLIKWLLPILINSENKFVLNNLSILSRWKILDNLRRSLVPFSLVSLLLMGWFIFPNPWIGTLTTSLIVLFTALASTGWQIFHKPEDLSFNKHLLEIRQSIQELLVRFVFGLSVLPFEAYSYLSSITLTWFRLIFSKRNLLEWVSSNECEKNSSNGYFKNYKLMWISPILAIITIYFIIDKGIFTSLVALPFILLWLLSPAITTYMSQPLHENKEVLDDSETRFLNQLARRTWTFFENFVNKSENYFPPDNFQEHPTEKIAHRTSPTNLGLSLLANVTAYDFGYIPMSILIDRTYNSLDSMNQLERYKGHFFNWYDTLTREILPPKYISTVDSGNLVGHLMVLKQALLSLESQPVFGIANLKGLSTVLQIIQQEGQESDSEFIREYSKLLDIAMGKNEISVCELKILFEKISAIEKKFNLTLVDDSSQRVRWFHLLFKQSEQIGKEIFDFIPWIGLESQSDKFQEIIPFDKIPSLEDLELINNRLKIYLSEKPNLNLKDEELLSRIQTLQERYLVTEKSTHSYRLKILKCIEFCDEFSKIEYDFLYDPPTHLLSIGYNVSEERKDNGNYDLLASEARLGIFVGIAQGFLPQDSWFSLGRLLNDSSNTPTLLSWSGSMFEYLMPLIVMPTFENTILDQTCHSIVNSQILYGKNNEVPWGISESGYNMVDVNFNYQYKAFGIPGLGLKRGLEKDMVVSPYSSMLALIVNTKESVKNLEILAQLDFVGDFGFWEAIDYTKSRLIHGMKYSIVQSYMAHHQGMSLLSLAYVLLDQPMQKRFMSDLSFKATALLLQEKIPRATVFFAHTSDILDPINRGEDSELRTISTPKTKSPEIQLLSNGSYQVMISNSGGGYSRWKELAINRWREDGLLDNYGMFLYIKDIQTNQFWSNTYQPTLKESDTYKVSYSQEKVSFFRKDNGIETKTDIIISPEDDVEMRRIKITNRTKEIKTLDITSYTEISISNQLADEAHPAFSNLFVETEIHPKESSLFAGRRPRSTDEVTPFMFHLMNVYGVEIVSVSFETDRREFIGRGRTVVNPQSMHQDILSGKSGAVLDPVFAIRYRIRIKPMSTATIDLSYGMTYDKNECYSLMYKYKDKFIKKRAFELSLTHSQVLLRQINILERDAQQYDMLAGSIIYSNSHMRAAHSIIQSNNSQQNRLWGHSISGDLPIILLRVQDSANIDFVKKIIQAHSYYRVKGLHVDIVIWNEEHGSYRNSLNELLQGMISNEDNTKNVEKIGRILIKSADQLSIEDRVLIQSVARVILYDNKGSIINQLNSIIPDTPFPLLLPTKKIISSKPLLELKLPSDLLFFNGVGGFTKETDEYKILTTNTKTTPSPWVNVIANKEFGTVVSESGSAYTWALNSHEYRLTPWANDPIGDTGGEAFYLRDDETGHFWSPLPFPCRGDGNYITTHGFGYSEFQHRENRIETKVIVSIDDSLPVKFIKIHIKNHQENRVNLSVMGFMEIILGDHRSKTNPHVISEYESISNVLLFRNKYSTDFPDRICFFKVLTKTSSFTCDRQEFIGSNSNLANPQGLYLKNFSGRVGSGIDTCGAIQSQITLIAGEEAEVIFLFGSAKDLPETEYIINNFKHSKDINSSIQKTILYWKNLTNKIQIQTPDLATNTLFNGWLSYQTIACRLFARSGFYQSGGAFGFRDQLQDALAVMKLEASLARDQILLAASRQFKEGDVQHWWHPPAGRGVRTRCSDDLLWLPYVLSEYLQITGDSGILDEGIEFIEMRELNHGEESHYDLPGRTDESETLYEHSVRAIRKSLVYGRNGLPLIGSGDWNDGMDQVGKAGLGESVWLGFFLYSVLEKFGKISESRKDFEFMNLCKEHSEHLKKKIELNAWDGEWYNRAFYDDGTVIGSKESDDCKIDSISQSWSVLSGLGDIDRQRQAMESMSKHLVNRELNLILLLHPPFDKTPMNPGYIKGYIPGVRENGGQYTHSAVWAMMAFAKLKDHETVWELLQMINPINHSLDNKSVETYKVEPYVMPADIYANGLHEGRGGWTWYTGSSALMHSFILESLVGMKIRDNVLEFNPCFPKEWDAVQVEYRFGESVYKITVKQVSIDSDKKWSLDGDSGVGNSIKLIDDGKTHEATIFA